MTCPVLKYFPLLVALALSGCANYAKISEVKPRFHPTQATSRALVSTESEITQALQKKKRDPLAAAGEFLRVAESAANQLQKNPADAAAIETYNFAVGRVIDIVGKANLNPWSQTIQVPGREGGYILAHKPDPRPAWNPALYDFTPADQFDLGGKYVKERTIKEGVGAPLVAVGKGENENAKKVFTIQKVYYGVTALIRFEGRRAIIAFEDPLDTERVRLGRRSFPLAADFTVPLAIMLVSNNPKQYELRRLLRPAKYAETARISRLQPYDPNKTVVLVIHGLMDSPATWTPMINHLRGDKEIRENCQFWFYSYPSGYPYPYSASILRRELDAIEERFPLRKKLVVIGHSMGGSISRLLITDTGNKIWMQTFGMPPEEVPMEPEDKKIFTDSLIFKHRPEIGRVIFISAPLRGSELASNWVGRIGSSLVKSPVTLLKAGTDALKFITFQTDDLKLGRIPNSVDTLAPNNRFVRTINTIPITPGIPYHVISGDRGKGGYKDRTKPVMSDGVVPYWSSHMEGAQSELVVPSNHSAHQNPQAIAEVKRILKRYAQ